jgi:hypothetical protein
MGVLLDVAIGMTVIALVFSIIVSGVNEWVAQAFARRGHFLRLGLQRLIADPAIYARILHHPLIGSMYRDGPAAGKPPSYIPAANFVRALADVLLTRASVAGSPVVRAGEAPSIAQLRAAISSPALAGSPVSIALRPMLDEAGNDVQAALKSIAGWYESGMDRVGGWYKVRTQKVLFVIGFVVAALFNVDAIEAVTTLARSEASRAAAVAVAEAAQSSGQIGNVRLGELKDRPPTVAEWQSLYPVLERLRPGEGAPLPVGYACLGRVIDAGSGDAARRTPDAAKAGISSRTGAPDSMLGPWRVCAEALRTFAATQPPSVWVLKLVGWSLMALAGTLGAVYWFGLLQSALKLRGSGQKPLPAES